MTRFEVVKGRGAASGVREYSDIGGSLRAQAPRFREKGLDITSFYLGTLNLRLAVAEWEMRCPLIRLTGIDWLPGYPPEDFDFAGACIEFKDVFYPSLVYFPRPETKTAYAPAVAPDIIEILAPTIPEIEYGSLGIIHFNENQIRLVEYIE